MPICHYLIYNFKKFKKIDINGDVLYNKRVMRIGNLQINGYAALAPMAGVADRAMREMCVRHGAAFTVGELTSAKGVSLGDKKSAALLELGSSSAPCAVQLFGCEPLVMAQAAQAAQRRRPDFIDINMGCPAPKVAGNGGGSALMRSPELAAEIVYAVVRAVELPVTVKMRTGWDGEHLNAPRLAALCEQAGAAAITVHGRTRMQMYAPPVDIDTIRAVKAAVKIPVIANGDVTSAATADEMLKKTGCDFLMVGRAARGNPFVFDEINAFFENKPYTPPTLEERLSACVEQVELMGRYKDPHNAILEARKHTAWYLSGISGAAALRRECGCISSMDDVKRICEKALERNAKL